MRYIFLQIVLAGFCAPISARNWRRYGGRLPFGEIVFTLSPSLYYFVLTQKVIISNTSFLRTEALKYGFWNIFEHQIYIIKIKY